MKLDNCVPFGRSQSGTVIIQLMTDDRTNFIDEIGPYAVVIDSEPHLSCTCKSSFLFAPLAVRVQTACSAFPFCTPTKPLIRLNIKSK